MLPWLALSLLVGATAFQASAATVVHYRFESVNSLADSSTNHLDLTAENSAGAVAIPGVGQGSDFPGTILSQPNDQMARTFDGGSAATRRTFTTPDSPLLNFNSTLTVELFFDMDSGSTAPTNGNSDYLVSVFGNALVNQAFGLGIINDGGTYRPRAVFGNGASIQALTFSSLSIAAGVDYFLAMTYDNGEVDMYLTNLDTDSQQTQELTFTNYDLADSAVGLRIGGLSSSSGNVAGSVFSGYLDEVRLSDAVLSQSEFLIPEPGLSALLMVASLAAVAGLRRSHPSKR